MLYRMETTTADASAIHFVIAFVLGALVRPANVEAFIANLIIDADAVGCAKPIEIGRNADCAIVVKVEAHGNKVAALRRIANRDRVPCRIVGCVAA